ncbi:unnamed protein product [Arctia plantaginis]|uniref:Uncharacterized protein n=1 Tax=Arctia plantaginis TaxID=874455 RepID=A0A8S1A4W7_ARCPL|nr:unnamed protein product [Arctia plantaginis]
MFIFVMYKDAPELSHYSRRSSSELDPSVEKTLLVNPNCQVRVMFEYIRKKCKLGTFTQFDLSEANGLLKGLFELDTFAYATNLFEHKRTYYLIVLKPESDKRLSVIPQLSQDNSFYQALKSRVNNYILTGAVSPSNTPPSKATPPGKITPPKTTSAKKK